MKILKAEVKIKNDFFDGITIGHIRNVEIESSWNTLTDTAVFQINNDYFQKNYNIFASKNPATGDEPILKRGDKIEINVSYSNGINNSIFSDEDFPNFASTFYGYITRVKPGSMITIYCEDAMWLLKRKTIQAYSETGKTASEFVHDMVGDKVEIGNVVETSSLGYFRIDNNPASLALESLKKYGLFSWIKNEKLYVGKVFSQTNEKEVLPFYFSGPNCNIIDSNLEYVIKDELKFSVKGTLTNSTTGAKTIKFAYWDDDDNIVITSTAQETVVKDFVFIGITNTEFEDSLKRLLPLSVYTGYKGSFTTFGYQKIKHGDSILLYDPKFVEREGIYNVKKVITTYGEDGFRQQVELSFKLK